MAASVGTNPSAIHAMDSKEFIAAAELQQLKIKGSVFCFLLFRTVLE
jgi:hypothetical protein